jgi:hypothetical protein
VKKSSSSSSSEETSSRSSSSEVSDRLCCRRLELRECDRESAPADLRFDLLVVGFRSDDRPLDFLERLDFWLLPGEFGWWTGTEPEPKLSSCMLR